jgi:hypothetical protein
VLSAHTHTLARTHARTHARSLSQTHAWSLSAVSGRTVRNVSGRAWMLRNTGTGLIKSNQATFTASLSPPSHPHIMRWRSPSVATVWRSTRGAAGQVRLRLAMAPFN